MRIAVLLTCHNRREKTLGCLVHLFDQVLPVGVSLTAFLVDDGSTDGTGAAVRERFPTVQVIEGDGSLFWCGGMRKAWSEAAPGDFDGYLWLNDDTNMYKDALESLLTALRMQECATGRRGIVFGACWDPVESRQSFGAKSECGLVPPAGEPRPARTFNGNLVLVTREAFQLLGNLDPFYRHSFGDEDYGLRAQRYGVPVWCAAGYLAQCHGNPKPAWEDPAVPLQRRWKTLHGPKGCPPRELAHFARLSRGWRWPLSVINLYRRVLRPR